ncbi:hypothetical protein POTOM_015330 [Populus tomentosa]|uniref:DUF4283 domain-containing protein n=1 Tax=Populus tomentosa TaxID=118781 RepID=A0A8X8A2V2_POPTO|nr:hypothetical protein POTOM_015330 [Populus tomentosa]
MFAQETCLPQKPSKLDSMKETVIYSPKPQDISWLKNCLLASISAGADYGKIQDDLISCDIQSTGMRFLEVSQVLLVFEDHPSMMHAFEADLPYWEKYFDDIRPWLSTDCAIDRLAWISIQGLPIVGWNRNSLATFLRSTRDIIGFDRLGLRRSAFISLCLLLGIKSDEDTRKTIILHIDGEDHTICIDEIDNLHYPMIDSICYSMDTFYSNLVLEDGYTTCGSESSSDGTIANFSVESTHNMGLDTREKMKSFSNCEKAATDKPYLAGDTTYREASYSAPTRLQDHNSLIIINALQQLGGRHTNDIEESTDDSDVHMGNRCHFQNVGDSHKHLCIIKSVQSGDEEAIVSLEDREVQGRARKLRAVGKLIDIHNIDVCFLLETKIKTCTDSFIFRVRNNSNVNWACNEAGGSRGGMIALWDDTKFQVLSVEYGYGWIGLYGQHMQSGFICAIVGVYAPCSMSEKWDLWKNLCILRHAFPILRLMVRDFNETLNQIDRSNGYLYIRGSLAFRNFLDSCHLIEYQLVGGYFIWFRNCLMSKLDRAFSDESFLLQFSNVMLHRLPREMLDHCPLLVSDCLLESGYRPFKFLDCWLQFPNFKNIIQGFWFDGCTAFPGRFRFIKKLSFVAT